jgi:cytidylate kinase
MIIGLSGYAQSGKDTVAKFLVENYGFTRVAFADNIRFIAYGLNPIVKPGLCLQDAVNEMGWEKAKTRIPEVRSILQNLGVAAREHLGEDIWVTSALNAPTETDSLVITDVRFTNEADAIKARGGKIWRVIRPGVNAVNTHVSETQMDGYEFDEIIYNDRGLRELEKATLEKMFIRL